MRLRLILLAGAIAGVSVPALAQSVAPAGLKAGATVSDTSGAQVGTIESVNGDLALLSTGAVKVSIPVSSFGAGASGPVLGMTKAQVEAAASGAAASSAAEAKAQTAALIKSGATVSDPTGAPVGKIEAVDGQFAVVATENSKVRLPFSAFGKGASGPVIGMTAAELDAAAKAAGGKSPSGGN